MMTAATVDGDEASMAALVEVIIQVAWMILVSFS